MEYKKAAESAAFCFVFSLFFYFFLAVKADQFPVNINSIEKSITAIDVFTAIAARPDEFTHPVNLQHKHTWLL